jgi:hypothetical protein
MRSILRTLLLVVSTAVIAPPFASAQTVVVFVDGTRMEVQSYEVKESLVLLKTKAGKLMSVPRSYVNLVATEQVNRKGAPSTPPPARTPAPAPKPTDRQSLRTETVKPEPPVRAPEPTPPPHRRPHPPPRRPRTYPRARPRSGRTRSFT